MEQAPGVGDGEGGLAGCSPWGLKALDTAERLNRTVLIDLFMAVLGLCCGLGFSLVAESGGYSLVAALGLLIAVNSLVEHRLRGLWVSLAVHGDSTGSAAVVHRLSCSIACGIFPD